MRFIKLPQESKAQTEGITFLTPIFDITKFFDDLKAFFLQYFLIFPVDDRKLQIERSKIFFVVMLPFLTCRVDHYFIILFPADLNIYFLQWQDILCPSGKTVRFGVSFTLPNPADGNGNGSGMQFPDEPVPPQPIGSVHLAASGLKMF